MDGDYLNSMPALRAPHITSRKLLFFLLTIMLIELILGGGGRFFKVGPLTVRMYLYFSAIPLALLLVVLRNRIDGPIALFAGMFGILLCTGVVLGYLNGAAMADIFEDVKPLSFFFSVFFMCQMIRTPEDIRKVTAIVRYSCLALGLAYILLVILLVIKVIGFLTLAEAVSPYDEVLFRGDGGLFFYKGFLYLGIGFFFFGTMKGAWNKVFAGTLLLATILTLTRGFLLATLLVYVCYLVFLHRNKLVAFVTLALSALGAIMALPFYLQSIGDKTESDLYRKLQFQEVMARVDWISVWVGKGFGVGVPVRPVHMEIAYLEIFHKQGVLGLAFWLGLFGYICFLFLKLYRAGGADRETAVPYFLAVLFTAFQSATNPYVNNPIGLSIVLLSLVVLVRLDKLRKEQRV